MEQQQSTAKPSIFCARCGRRKTRVQREEKKIRSSIALLSPREYSVMLAIADGESPKSCAKRLRLEVKTIHTYRARILEKLELSSNAEIAVAAFKAGLME